METLPAPLAIGALSQRTGCQVETIRYYEQVGLLPRPPRTPGGYRQYGPKHVTRLAFIRRARLAPSLITRLPDGSAIVVGTTPLDDLRQELGIAVDDSDTYMTTAGLVIAALDAIPAPGASVVRGGHRWTVLEVDGPRVTKLRVQREP